MGPFIIIALIVFLIIIVISVFIYPLLCTSIALACKRVNGIVTGFLLLLTMAFYLFACTTLEESLDNWCYSVYAGIVLTPIFLFFSTELEEPSRRSETGDNVQCNKKPILILTFFTSLLFTIEGVLRMAHSYSVHRLLNFGWLASDIDSYRFYYEEFHYAGSLLFFVSLFSALIIGYNFYSSYKKYQRNVAFEVKKRSRIKRRINDVSRCLKTDSDFLMSFDSRQVDEAILYYNAFCQKIIAALESSDEKTNLSFEFRAFNNIKTSYKVLLLSNKNRSFYFYPMGIVVRDSNDAYKYIPNGRDTVSVNFMKKDKRNALPSEIRPICQYWRYSCLDGSPDLRYKHNPKIYVYEYGFLRIAELILHVYRVNTGKDVVSEYKKLYSYVSQLKQERRNEKKNVLPEGMAVSYGNFAENKERVSIAEQSEDIKAAELRISIDNPKTLEDCFSVVILNHGKEILKDNNLVSIISSYKQVDLIEYKDVLDEMVSDNFLYQFTEPGKQNDFALYNLSGSFARQKKVNAQKVLFITQALVTAIKKLYNNTQK